MLRSKIILLDRSHDQQLRSLGHYVAALFHIS